MTAHFFTVDVEEYFQVLALAPHVPRERWEGLESRVEASTRLVLELLGRHDAHGTFFTLGWVAERHPQLIRDIAAAGHEVASHTWDHRRVTEQAPGAFRDSVRRTKALLEDLTGAPCVGFRAPSYSIVRGTEWALDVLLEEGYRYDSSLFPVTRPGYGYSGGGRDPYWIERPSGRLAEVPPATLRRVGLNLPAAGGAYFRLLPDGLVAAGLRDAARRGASGTFYIHPWELDPDQPRFPVGVLTRIRHYGGLARTAGRLERLLSEFRFTAIAPGFGLAPPAIAGTVSAQ
jgi:polysaccharide deacetylase family protein (PEP-CTERM system associated)